MWWPWAWRRGRTGGVVDKISGCVVREQRPAVSTNSTSGPARVPERHHHHHLTTTHHHSCTTATASTATSPRHSSSAGHTRASGGRNTMAGDTISSHTAKSGRPSPGASSRSATARPDYHLQFTIYFSLPGRHAPLTSHTTPCSGSCATFEAHFRHWTLDFGGEKREGSRRALHQDARLECVARRTRDCGGVELPPNTALFYSIFLLLCSSPGTLITPHSQPDLPET